ncbi:hypothetical protein [Methylophilus sp. 14]|uniref:hypothetical protein n=1 Tax=Methylophilus sp. 14 TaxID=2781019 RepID=UPI00188E71D6|nr:hypothetical protein [Methylophilus sp. 14]MBF4987055.1 hypothetical protein [Methylophilus sp. 14]
MTMNSCCYMCDLPGTTVEHVPPRSIFPESKDVGGQDYRKNLITVLSCPAHNNQKSHDDEFLMVSLAGIIGNNSIGYQHKFTKVDRAIRRSANTLLNKAVTKKQKVTKIRLDNNRFIDVISGTPDVTRLLQCFDRIVRGLHQHHFSQQLKGEVQVLLGYLFYSDPSSKNFTQFVADKVVLELDGKPRFGENQEVFYYQITDPDQYNLFLFRLCFYGGLNIYAAVLPEGVKRPFDLGSELINLGVKTIITLGEKSYEIN